MTNEAPGPEPASTGARLTERAYDRIDTILGPVDAALARDYPGDRLGGQPIHTVYVSASDASVDLPQQWGSDALALLDANREVFDSLDSAGIVPRVREILERSPVQDLRIDFEDGYG